MPYSYKFCHRDISSRFFLAPINTGLVNEGIPSDGYIKFYEKRSGKMIGATYVGNVATSINYTTNQRTVYISKRKELLDKLYLVANKINDNGSLPAIQLACRDSKMKPLFDWTNNDKPGYIKLSQEEVLSYSPDTIRSIVNDISSSAVLVHRLGFQLIQIHSAHGYFFSRLLNRLINRRNDEYSFENLTFLHELVDQIKGKCPEAIIDFRVNLLDGIEDSRAETDYKHHVYEKLIKAGTDVISLSSGFYDLDKSLIYPGKSKPNCVNLEQSLYLSSTYDKVHWNCAGNIMDIRTLLHLKQANLSFSICRSLIADPHFIEKSINDDFKNINICNYCGMCHYYSHGYMSIYCPLDADLEQLPG